jgi:hypothetical protein
MTDLVKSHIDILSEKTKNLLYTPSELATRYGFPSAVTSDVTIGILSFGGGLYGIPNSLPLGSPYVVDWTTAQSTDIYQYLIGLGLSVGNFPQLIIYPVNKSTDTSDGTSPENSTLENTLDISLLASLCCSTRVTIVLYLFSFSGFYDAVNYVLNDPLHHPTIISISWGAFEIDETEMENLNNCIATARIARPHINICASSGDTGSSGNKRRTNRDYSLSVCLPAACPNVTAVGGTALQATSEVVWNDNSGATGGGISSYFRRPAYQTKYINNTYRNVPDISLKADGITILYNGEAIDVAGTSMSAPLFAAYLALIKPTLFVNPILYGAANGTNVYFNDITSGNNIFPGSGQTRYYAQTGYDCCTGIGSIKGMQLKGLLTDARLTLILMSGTNSQVISGDGNVTISGPVTLAGASTYTGVTNIFAPTNLTGSLASSTTHVHSTLQGTGAITGNVLIGQGGIISPGSTGSIGTLRFGDTTMTDGSTLTIKFNFNTNSGAPGVDWDFLITEKLTLEQGVTINLNLSSMVTFTTGAIFNIIQFTSVENFNSSNFILPTGWTIACDLNTKKINISYI